LELRVLQIMRTTTTIANRIKPRRTTTATVVESTTGDSTGSGVAEDVCSRIRLSKGIRFMNPHMQRVATFVKVE